MSAMNKLFYTCALIFILASCGSDEEPVKKEKDTTEDVETFDFSGKVFKDSIHLKLLKELDICELELADSSMYAPCTPEYFQIYPFHKDRPVEDAFVLYVKAAIPLKGQPFLLPVRHVIVFERENGKLVRTNGYRGELVGMSENKNGFKDLMIALYLTGDETTFDCLFKYKDGQFSFHSVDALDWGEGNRKIKEDLKDSLSKEVYNDLMEKQLIF